MDNSVLMRSADGTKIRVAPQFVNTFLGCGYTRAENEKSDSHTEKEIEAGTSETEKKQVKRSSSKSSKQA